MYRFRLFRSVLPALLLAASASAQITISSVVNAASRQPTNVAQGALIAITGKGVGVDFQQATFPLPTTGGLGGVTVQATVAGAVVDCIMVYVKLTEVGVILPSATPLGAGAITVNNNGVSGSKDIIVVSAEFGIFTTNFPVALGNAVAFNINPDGSTTPNSTISSVMPGQDIFINGTGLGAISSDETQPGVTDAPSTTFKAYVGFTPAVVVSAARGMCCDGIDPAYPILEGIAAWDVIRITIPQGVSGCYMPVAIQIGTTVSNLAAIAIDPSGAACTGVASILPQPPDTLVNQAGVSGGSIGLGRDFAQHIDNRGVVVTTKDDSGGATFVRYPGLPASSITPIYRYPEGVCSVNGWPGANGPGSVDVNGNPVTVLPLKPPVPLDAGTPIVVKGPNGSRNIVKRTVANIIDYPSVSFGNTTPGNFFDPGHYTVTGPVGKDVGPFTASIDVPAMHLAWTNIPDITKSIDRTQDLVVTWTGGAPGTQVTVGGTGVANGVNTAFQCAAAVEAGQMTIPSYVLLQIPAISTSPITGGLDLENAYWVLFTSPGLDYGTITFTDYFHLQVKYE